MEDDSHTHFASVLLLLYFLNIIINRTSKLWRSDLRLNRVQSLDFLANTARHW
jgi:hypothetical protein